VDSQNSLGQQPPSGGIYDGFAYRKCCSNVKNKPYGIFWRLHFSRQLASERVRIQSLRAGDVAQGISLPGSAQPVPAP